MQVMRVVLGETCTRFTPGRDGGRDGWFVGQANAKLQQENRLHGQFIVQCKHTSATDHLLEPSLVKPEIPKLSQLSASAPVHYILMTNRRTTAQVELSIRQAVEPHCNGGYCLVLGES